MITLESMVKERLTNVSNELILHHDIKGFVDWGEGKREAYLDVLELIDILKWRNYEH